MQKLSFIIFCLCAYICTTAQVTSKVVTDIEVSSSQLKFLGKSDEIRNLTAKQVTSKEKKDALRKTKKVPDNFKGRRGESKAFYLDKEHQGPDPIRQGTTGGSQKMVTVDPLVNIDGIGSGGSPLDPTGDVSDQYYVQAVNVTDVGVYDLEGNLIQEFAMNTLWTEFNSSSAGDPIILFDEESDQWIITEFTGPSNLLIAISEDGDPLGSYTAYSFSTPNFPDYPKYAISPQALIVTTNEEGAGTLHQYFIDRAALMAGEDNVTMQRVAIQGNTDTEAGFYVSTPVDWNGANQPYDDSPIVIRINDSSWAGGPDEDQVEIYSFDIDFDDQNNTQVRQTSIVTTPFDSYPCSAGGFGFACIPQPGGDGLDGIPEVIMNIPHLRNFGTHESMVFNFITDVTDGQNLSGIRWVELRRTINTDWTLYQEGTYAPDDGLDRFMGSIAIDHNGNIGLAYNVSSENDFVGVRFTGRFASDPLGEMTIDETVAVEGVATINSFGRFGDYSQMSVSPAGDNVFWFTTEYAGDIPQTTETRIVAFQLAKDSFDLAAVSIDEPTTSSALSATELVTGTFRNAGVNTIDDYTVSLLLENEVVETINLTTPLAENEEVVVQFDTEINMSIIQDYNIGIAISTETDNNIFNDTINSVITKLPTIDLSIVADVETGMCDSIVPATLMISNAGDNIVTTANIDVIVNGETVDQIMFAGSLGLNETEEIKYDIADNLIVGDNNITFAIVDINGGAMDFDESDNSVDAFSELLDASNFITLVFLADEYPEETSWVLTYQGSNEILSSGNLVVPFVEYREDICIQEDACLTLIVFDSYGDGMCCDFGEGNISVFNGNGELIAFDYGEFSNSTTLDFCQDPLECLLEAEIETVDASGEGVSDGVIGVDAVNGIMPFTYSIDNNASSQESNIFNDLTAGDYTVIVTDATGLCTYTETVSVGISTSITEIDGQLVTFTVMPNPTDGVFKITLDNMTTSENHLEIEILDIAGYIIQSKEIGKWDEQFIGTFSLYDYADGTYFIRVKHPKGQLLERVVKQ